MELNPISFKFQPVGGHFEFGPIRMIWMNQYRTMIFGGHTKFGFTAIQFKRNQTWNNIWFSGY